MKDRTKKKKQMAAQRDCVLFCGRIDRGARVCMDEPV